MTLKERLDNDLKDAMRSRDEVRAATIRMCKAAIKNKEVELKKELDDALVLNVLSKLAKQREESIGLFEKGGRKDLADRERAELKVINAYLPQQMTEAEILAEIEKAINETGAKTPKEMGKVMKVLMPKITGRADGKIVSSLVQKRLQQK